MVSSKKYLERLLDLDRDLETERLYEGDREYLDLLEYDICDKIRQNKTKSKNHNGNSFVEYDRTSGELNRQLNIHRKADK